MDSLRVFCFVTFGVEDPLDVQCASHLLYIYIHLLYIYFYAKLKDDIT